MGSKSATKSRNAFNLPQQNPNCEFSSTWRVCKWAWDARNEGAAPYFASQTQSLLLCVNSSFTKVRWWSTGDYQASKTSSIQRAEPSKMAAVKWVCKTSYSVPGADLGLSGWTSAGCLFTSAQFFCLLPLNFPSVSLPKKYVCKARRVSL